METKAKVSQVILNSGQKMPALAFGTAVSPIPPPETLAPIFVDAIEIGYRHFDTASLYCTEEPLGRAVAQAVERGIIGNRSEMFVTTKLWCSDAHPDLVVPALRASLKRLGLEYVDLYLIHWPVRLKQGSPLIPSHEDVLPFDMKGTWEAMEECSRLGLTKSIGVSNFSTKKLNFLLENGTIPPAVNQVEMNAGWQQKQMVEFCKGKGIQVSAWSALGASGTFYGSGAVVENNILKEIALSKQKTLAQVALRWVVDQGASPIVKSFNKERMKQNLDIFGWELTQDELDKIRQIPQKRTVFGNNFIHENGPIKSVEELWDGEA